MVRLFIAIDLPDELRDQFIDLRPELKGSRARLTLVDRDSLHITLKFIGEVEGSRLNQISDALSPVCVDPFTISLGLITANNNRNPRVIWSDIHDETGSCAKLSGMIDQNLYPLGIPRETRTFHPHITIARVKQFHPSLFETLSSISSLCSGTFIVDHYTLKKSELTPDGPIYTDIRTYPLQRQENDEKSA